MFYKYLQNSQPIILFFMLLFIIYIIFYLYVYISQNSWFSSKNIAILHCAIRIQNRVQNPVDINQVRYWR